MNDSLCFGARPQELLCYGDAEWVGDIDMRRSMSVCLVTFAGNCILAIEIVEVHCNLCYRSKGHAVIKTSKEILWIK